MTAFLTWMYLKLLSVHHSYKFKKTMAYWFRRSSRRFLPRRVLWVQNPHGKTLCFILKLLFWVLVECSLCPFHKVRNDTVMCPVMLSAYVIFKKHNKRGHQTDKCLAHRFLYLLHKLCLCQLPSHILKIQLMYSLMIFRVCLYTNKITQDNAIKRWNFALRGTSISRVFKKHHHPT